MAIVGVSSAETVLVTQYYGSVNKAQGAAASINFSLCWAPDPENRVSKFLVKHTLGVQSTGASSFRHEYHPYSKFTGPGILKVQGLANTTDVEGSAGFDIIRVTN